MPGAVALLRDKADKCRLLAKGQDEQTHVGLRKLAHDYDEQADVLEAAARKLS